jgi:uncharacterized protein HemY
MKKKLKIEDPSEVQVDSRITSSYIQATEQQKLQSIQPVDQKSVIQPLQTCYKPLSCFLLHIIGRAGLRLSIAETELKTFRSSFNSMLSKDDNCHEAHFGLGKLHAYVGEFEIASKHLKKAASLNFNDQMYRVWAEVLQNFIRKDLELKKESLLSKI